MKKVVRWFGRLYIVRILGDMMRRALVIVFGFFLDLEWAGSILFAPPPRRDLNVLISEGSDEERINLIAGTNYLLLWASMSGMMLAVYALASIHVSHGSGDELLGLLVLVVSILSGGILAAILTPWLAAKRIRSRTIRS